MSILSTSDLSTILHSVKEYVDHQDAKSASDIAQIDTVVSTALTDLNERLSNAGEIIAITYTDLKALRDGGKLKAGAWYRLTDYKCGTTQSGTRAQNHQFDILIFAMDANTLNENCLAMHHDGDTYFANSKLEAWELKYTIDNDTTKYAWADATNGKGVIFGMKDEFSNNVAYDFKNIQFERDADFKATYGSSASDVNATDGYYYTFSYIDNGAACDITMNSESCNNNSIVSWALSELPNNVFIQLNIIKPLAHAVISGTNNTIVCHQSYCLHLAAQVYQNLIVSYKYLDNFNAQNMSHCLFDIRTNGISEFSSKFISNSTFTGPQMLRTFINQMDSCVFESSVDNTQFCALSQYVTVKGNCSNFLSSGNMYRCTFKSNLSYSSFECNAKNLTVDGLCVNLVLRSYVENITAKGNFAQSVVKYNMNNCTFNQHFANNTVDCDMVGCVIDCYFRNCHFGHKVQYVHFNGDATQVNNYRIANGLHGASGNLLQVTPRTGSTVERILAQNSQGQVVDYCPADLVPTA